MTSELKYAFPLEDFDKDIKDGFYNIELCDDCKDPFYWIGACWDSRRMADFVSNKRTVYRIRVRVK
jgi:hypothetical protein